MNFLEPQQSEDVKAWFSKHGMSLLTSFLLAAVVVSGYSFWQKRQEMAKAAASSLYNDYQQALSADNAEVMKASLAQLQERYPRSVYTSSAMLLEASRAAFDKDWDAARLALKAVEQQDKSFLQPLVALRLAQIALQEQQYDQAKALLDGLSLAEGTPAAAYQPAFDELQGDIALAQADVSAAAAYYEKAAKGYTDQGFDNVLLQMKRETYAAPAVPAVAPVSTDTTESTQP